MFPLDKAKSPVCTAYDVIDMRIREESIRDIILKIFGAWDGILELLQIL